MSQDQVGAQDVQRAIDTVLEELGSRYIPLAEVVGRVSDLLCRDVDAALVEDAVRDAAADDEAERYDRDRDDALTGTVFLDPAVRDPEWAARMDHYFGDTRGLVAF